MKYIAATTSPAVYCSSTFKYELKKQFFIVCSESATHVSVTLRPHTVVKLAVLETFEDFLIT